MTNSCPPNWRGWTARSAPPTPNGAASSTSTRAGSSNSPKCSAAPPKSHPAEKNCSTSEPASPTNEPRSPVTTSSDTVHDFAARIHAVIGTLDNTQKQQLMRLLIEDVRVTGWHVQIRLRVA